MVEVVDAGAKEKNNWQGHQTESGNFPDQYGTG